MVSLGRRMGAIVEGKQENKTDLSRKRPPDFLIPNICGFSQVQLQNVINVLFVQIYNIHNWGCCFVLKSCQMKHKSIFFFLDKINIIREISRKKKRGCFLKPQLLRIFPGGFFAAPMNKRFSKYLLALENFRPPETVVYKITPK